MDVIAEFGRICEQRAEEARVAELAAMGAAAAKRSAEAARASAAERRGRLADELEAARTLLEGAMARLGDVRSEAAKTAREIKVRADRVVDGDEKVAGAIARLQDMAQMQQALVRAHERKVLELEGRVELAAAALAEHDAEVAAAGAVELEKLAELEATGVDELLARVAARAGVLFAAVDARRSAEADGARVREAWVHGLVSPSARHQSLARCFAAAIASLEANVGRVGSSTPKVSMTGLLRDAIQAWRAGSERSAAA